jgi:aconitate hydratase
MAMGEGGPELVKQLLNRTYDIPSPDVVCIRLTGAPRHGVGPQDVALAIIGHVFANGFVKNSVMEFVGDGIKNLPMEFRIGIDVMTTETTCLSSIWVTDDKTKAYFDTVGRSDDFSYLTPAPLAKYDRAVDVDLSAIQPMIALPFHPSNVYSIAALKANTADIFGQSPFVFGSHR